MVTASPEPVANRQRRGRANKTGVVLVAARSCSSSSESSQSHNGRTKVKSRNEKVTSKNVRGRSGNRSSPSRVAGRSLEDQPKNTPKATNTKDKRRNTSKIEKSKADKSKADKSKADKSKADKTAAALVAVRSGSISPEKSQLRKGKTKVEIRSEKEPSNKIRERSRSRSSPSQVVGKSLEDDLKSTPKATNKKDKSINTNKAEKSKAAKSKAEKTATARDPAPAKRSSKPSDSSKLQMGKASPESQKTKALSEKVRGHSSDSSGSSRVAAHSRTKLAKTKVKAKTKKGKQRSISKERTDTAPLAPARRSLSSQSNKARKVKAKAKLEKSKAPAKKVRDRSNDRSSSSRGARPSQQENAKVTLKARIEKDKSKRSSSTSSSLSKRVRVIEQRGKPQARKVEQKATRKSHSRSSSSSSAKRFKKKRVRSPSLRKERQVSDRKVPRRGRSRSSSSSNFAARKERAKEDKKDVRSPSVRKERHTSNRKVASRSHSRSSSSSNAPTGKEKAKEKERPKKRARSPVVGYGYGHSKKIEQSRSRERSRKRSPSRQRMRGPAIRRRSPSRLRNRSRCDRRANLRRSRSRRPQRFGGLRSERMQVLGGIGRRAPLRPRLMPKPVGLISAGTGLSRPPLVPLQKGSGKTSGMPEKFSDEMWEEHREKRGLKLIGEICAPGIQWTYPVKDELRRSFAGFLSCPFDKDTCTALYQRARDGTAWKQPQGPHGLMPRKTAWMVSRGCTCSYKYGRVEVDPEEFPPWMLELMKLVMPLCGLNEPSEWPNSCNLNHYEDGSMSVGWHTDDERIFQGKFQDIRIISLSLGVKRKFEMRANWPEAGDKPLQALLLGDGDLCTMEGMFQKHFQHRVPKEGYVNGPRINLTWRWNVTHTPRCPAKRMRMC